MHEARVQEEERRRAKDGCHKSASISRPFAPAYGRGSCEKSLDPYTPRQLSVVELRSVGHFGQTGEIWWVIGG